MSTLSLWLSYILLTHFQFVSFPFPAFPYAQAINSQCLLILCTAFILPVATSFSPSFQITIELLGKLAGTLNMKPFTQQFLHSCVALYSGGYSTALEPLPLFSHGYVLVVVVSMLLLWICSLFSLPRRDHPVETRGRTGSLMEE